MRDEEDDTGSVAKEVACESVIVRRMHAHACRHATPVPTNSATPLRFPYDAIFLLISLHRKRWRGGGRWKRETVERKKRENGGGDIGRGRGSSRKRGGGRERGGGEKQRK